MEASVGFGDRAHLVAELARSEQRFLDVIEANADAIVVVDSDGIVRFANRAAEALFRRNRDELVDCAFGFPLVSGETTELDLTRPGQPAAVVEMRVVESEWEGAPACIATLRDITERKDAERAARRLIREQAARSAAEDSASRFRFLADSSTALSASLDHGAVLSALAQLCCTELADWVVVYVVAPDGGVGRLEVAHRDPAHRELVAELRADAIEPDSGHPVLEVLRTREPLLVREVGEDHLVSVAQDPRHLEILRGLGVASYMLVPLVARGRSVGALALVSSSPDRLFDDDDAALARDLALRAALAVDNARLYYDAQEANRAKSHLLAVISHDLRTPLSSIIGYADLLRMGVPEPLPEVSRGHVERIRTGAQHLLYLIEELLAFARLDAGHAELQLREVTVQEVAYEVADVIEPLAAERGLKFELDLPDTPTTLRTDPGKLRQILVNLAGNALKFTPEGEVRLEANPVDGHVLIRVSDTGIGIAPEHIDQIFQPFWQVDGETGGSGGSGLGLSVVQRLTSTLGGEISVESATGQGSAFTVTLPRHILDARA